MDTDVIVVGAGPGGSTAARELAARGLEVLMLDRARFPRDKPCGGGVTIRCAQLLPFDISPVVEQVVTGAQVRFRTGRNVARNFDGVLTYMTQRRRLDAFLAEQAQEAGAEFRDGQQVSRVARMPDGSFEVDAGGEIHRARALVGADGANGVVATSLGFERPFEAAVALEGNIATPGGTPRWLQGRVALQLGGMPGGYGWVFPKGDHVNVGVGGWKAVAGSRLREELEATCRAYGLDPAKLTNLRGHHLPMQRPGAPIVAGGAALVGDAAGLVDPLSGEGIYAAIASGTAVAPAIEDYLEGHVSSLVGYQHTVRREVVRDIEASRALMDIFHAWPGPWVFLLQRSGMFWRTFCRTVRGDTSYDGLVHSFGPLYYTLAPLARAGRAVTGRRWGPRMEAPAPPKRAQTRTATLSPAGERGPDPD